MKWRPLGMYEVSPEDFALTEFICVSKQPHQNIIREGLDLMRKENRLIMSIKSKLHEIKRKVLEEKQWLLHLTPFILFYLLQTM